MTEAQRDDFSIAVTSFFMKVVGLWTSDNETEQRKRNITLCYTILQMMYGVYLQSTDFYHSKGDFSALLYTLVNILSVVIGLFKVIVLFVHKKDFFNLVMHLQQHFLNATYDNYEKTILNTCKNTCAIFIGLFTFFTHVTLICYVTSPLIVNMGKNESDRMLPFKMYLDLPLSMSPYYEIIFIIEALALYQIGVCYFCFDNCLCLMNLHVATQFRILQYRLANMRNTNEKETIQENSDAYRSTEKSYAAFKSNVQQHQSLIAYCNKLEKVFNLFALGQMLVFSLIICFDGCQVIMVELYAGRRFIFLFHLINCLAQLLMFTYSCDQLIHESVKIATAVYRAPWTCLPMTKYGRELRKDAVFVIMRSKIPCCLTAKGFFPVSLETYTKVWSTAASYFTLLRQAIEI
nr:odorant receptor 13a-like [Nomia melanderi]